MSIQNGYLQTDFSSRQGKIVKWPKFYRSITGHPIKIKNAFSIGYWTHTSVLKWHEHWVGHLKKEVYHERGISIMMPE